MNDAQTLADEMRDWADMLSRSDDAMDRDDGHNLLRLLRALDAKDAEIQQLREALERIEAMRPCKAALCDGLHTPEARIARAALSRSNTPGEQTRRKVVDPPKPADHRPYA